MNNRPNLYFSGIAGSGMSALALFMSQRGNRVYGSDRQFDVYPAHPLLDIFKSCGIRIVAQNRSSIEPDTDMAVFSTAVEHSSPDYLRAKELSVPIKTRPELLADLVRDFRTIAVAGTSGKSTTSGMLAFLMSELWMEPNLIGGGRVRQFRDRVNQGNFLYGGSNILVIEACESDGSIVNYHPASTILLNLELDHHSIEETANMFSVLIENTHERTIINADDKRLSPLIRRGSTTFSLFSEAEYRPDFFLPYDLYTIFSIRGIEMRLSLPGRYNLYNALACIAYLSEAGVLLKDISEVLHNFRGIERRFEIHLNHPYGLVIDDYAHNPHKISSLMEAAVRLRGSICYVFQPHGYGPTRLMRDGYIDAFSAGMRDTDHLILLPIYYAGGTASRDISSADIAEAIKKRGRSVEAVGSRDEVLDRTDRYKAFIVMGARDDSLSDLASEIAKRLANLSPIS